LFKKKEKTPEVQKSGTSAFEPEKAAPASKAKPAPTADQQRSKAALAAQADSGSRTVQGITMKDIKVGKGAEATRGRRVSVHYVGKLKTNGRIFDQSKKPFQFGLGCGEVITGWDLGVSGMKVGGKRNLIIPPQMAYGKSGAPPTIPPNATLVFDVELLSVK
jgi:FKBP-type peptidyl-prolyl cis-trans isomerase